MDTINRIDEEPERTNSVDVGILLEKQLLMEKTRVGQLTNDNQRLLSQNISLCQAIKQQKAEMRLTAARNKRLEQQVAKLFLTVRHLSRSNQPKSDKEQEMSRSLQHEFQVLKEALTRKDGHIEHLQTANRELTCSASSMHSEHQEAKVANGRHVAERQEYERVIQTIVSLQAAMESQGKAMKEGEREKAKLSKLVEVNAVSSQEKQRKLQDALADCDCKSRQLAQQSDEIAALTAKLEAYPALVQHIEQMHVEGAHRMLATIRRLRDVDRYQRDVCL